MSRILLLGATGLIGNAVADRFASAGHHVMAVLRHPACAPDSVSEAIKGDLARPEAWLSLLDQADALIHCACDWAGNMEETEPRLIEGVTGRNFKGRILYTGGVWGFGNAPGAINEETPIFIPKGFDWALDGWRRLCSSEADALCIHPGLVWHERAPHYSPIEQALKNRNPLPLLLPGTQIQPLVHAADMAEGYLRACENGRSRREYLFVGENLTMDSIVHGWSAANGLPVVEVESGPDDPYTWSQTVNSHRALDELGWAPRHTDLKLALSQMAEP